MKRLILLFLLLVILASCEEKAEKVKFLVYTDLHHDLIPDAEDRLKTIIQNAERNKVDFMIEIGDFAFALPKNKVIKDILESTSIPTYHTLGNHDMDKNSKNEYLDFWELPAAHYYFDRGMFRFVVLDSNFFIDDEGNEQHYDHGNYYIDESRREKFSKEQLTWLEKLLQDKDHIYILFAHGPINDQVTSVSYNQGIHEILKKAVSGGTRIAAAFGGHNHSDNYHEIDGINYLQVNSASYFWAGSDFVNTERYPQEIYDRYPALKYMIPYESTLYAIVEMDNKGNMKITGTEGNYLPPLPDEKALNEAFIYPCSPDIKNRNISF